MTGPLRPVGSAVGALPASAVRESERHQRSPIPWSCLGDNPGATSRRSIHLARANVVVINAWGRLRSSGCGVNRSPTQDGERRETNLRPRARSSSAIASDRKVEPDERRALDVQSGGAGNPRVCGYAAVLGGWQMPATQRPPTVAIRPSWLVRKRGARGSLAPKVSDRRVYRWRTRPPARSCGVKSALENLVVQERKSETRA